MYNSIDIEAFLKYIRQKKIITTHQYLICRKEILIFQKYKTSINKNKIEERIKNTQSKIKNLRL